MLADLRAEADVKGPGNYADGFANTLQAFMAREDGDFVRAGALLASVQIPFSNQSNDPLEGRPLNRWLLADLSYEKGDYERSIEIWETLALDFTEYVPVSFLYRGSFLRKPWRH